jgi:hypothetical protein
MTGDYVEDVGGNLDTYRQFVTAGRCRGHSSRSSRNKHEPSETAYLPSTLATGRTRRSHPLELFFRF